ncbi:MAG TPA: hypothetical protein VJS44_11140 [Pyrinomonadaceae bacterium]|nr:hypothetical protein [Pyrinomonadaceae bacterium]
MEQKKSKYDTNPLDPDVARRTDDVWGATRATSEAQASSQTEDVEGATRDIRQATPQPQPARERLEAEAPTRRYDSNPKTYPSYPSVFVPPAYQPPTAQGAASGISSGASAATQPPPPAAPHAQPFTQPPTNRPVANVKLPENIVLMLPYLPFPFIGAVVGAVLLFLLPRAEARARFHAAQGLALHVIVLAVSVLVGIVEDVLPGSAGWALAIASAAFQMTAFIFFIVSMFRVHKGEPHVVTPVSELTKLLNERIEPRK